MRWLRQVGIHGLVGICASGMEKHHAPTVTFGVSFHPTGKYDGPGPRGDDSRPEFVVDIYGSGMRAAIGVVGVCRHPSTHWPDKRHAGRIGGQRQNFVATGSSHETK